MALTDEQVKELEHEAKHAPEAYVRMKALAVLGLHDGHSPTLICRILRVSRQSIYQWQRRYERQGLAGLLMHEGRGRKPKADLQELQKYVRQSPRAFGIARTRWTLSLLADTVPSLDGFSPFGVQKALARAGLCYKRGQPWLHSPDPEYLEKKKAIDEALMLARSEPSRYALLYQDEGTFCRQPSQAWLWASLGRRQPRMPFSHRSNTRLGEIGYLDAVTGAVRAEDTSSVTAPCLARSVSGISEWYPTVENIFLVWDNWPVHDHPKVLQALARQDRVKLLKLPTYSPWLNPIEKGWRWARQRVSHAHPWCDDFRMFREALGEEFQRLSAGSPELLRYVGLSS